MRYTIVLFMVAFVCCAPHIVQAQKKRGAAPHLLVYKTKKDYSNKVCVMLSEDRTKVVSYPDPGDLRALGNDVIPTPLHKGYLLDNNGIGLHTAFIKMTNKEYEKLAQVPTPEELYKMIIDKDPLVILCDCGSKYSYTNPVARLNILIDHNDLMGACKVMKKAGKK